MLIEKLQSHCVFSVKTIVRKSWKNPFKTILERLIRSRYFFGQKRIKLKSVINYSNRARKNLALPAGKRNICQLKRIFQSLFDSFKIPWAKFILVKQIWIYMISNWSIIKKFEYLFLFGLRSRFSKIFDIISLSFCCQSFLHHTQYLFEYTGWIVANCDPKEDNC